MSSHLSDVNTSPTPEHHRGTLDEAIPRGVDPSLYNHDLAPTKREGRKWSAYNFFALWANDVHSLGNYSFAMGLFALGLGTTFPISVVSIQNAVHRSQVGTVTGALNFFRALAASFTVAAFTAILLTALGADISLAGEQRSTVSGIAGADMVAAFRWVFGAAAALMAGATLLMLAMEERPLAGPASVPAEMAE